MTDKALLQARLVQIQEALKDIPGIALRDIREFIDGQMAVTRKGGLKLPLTFPVDEILPRPDDVSQVVRGEWKIIPLLLFVSADDE